MPENVLDPVETIEDKFSPFMGMNNKVMATYFSMVMGATVMGQTQEAVDVLSSLRVYGKAFQKEYLK